MAKAPHVTRQDPPYGLLVEIELIIFFWEQLVRLALWSHREFLQL